MKNPLQVIRGGKTPLFLAFPLFCHVRDWRLGARVSKHPHAVGILGGSLMAPLAPATEAA